MNFVIEYQLAPAPGCHASVWHEWPKPARTLADAARIIAKLPHPERLILITISPVRSGIVNRKS